jgi:acyl-CoA dehydrogenase
VLSSCGWTPTLISRPPTSIVARCASTRSPDRAIGAVLAGRKTMPVLNVDRADFLKEEDIVIFEDSAAKFLDEHAPPPRVEKWREAGIVERAMWREAGEAGLLCLAIPEAYGGAGGDFRHEVVLMEQIARKEVSGFSATLHNAIVAPYILHYGSEEQKKKWLPKMASGEFIGAIAMSEPGAGSDLQGVKTSARLQGNH